MNSIDALLSMEHDSIRLVDIFWLFQLLHIGRHITNTAVKNSIPGSFRAGEQFVTSSHKITGQEKRAISVGF